MGKDKNLGVNDCWLCRRTKDELAKDNISLEPEDVPYEDGIVDTPGKATVAICKVCEGLLRSH